jgi:hypothetical protein
MGLSEYCQDINRINADALIATFEALVRDADELERMIVQRVDESRRALDEQYQLLFGGPFDQTRSVHAATAAT